MNNRHHNSITKVIKKKVEARKGIRDGGAADAAVCGTEHGGQRRSHREGHRCCEGEDFAQRTSAHERARGRERQA